MSSKRFVAMILSVVCLAIAIFAVSSDRAPAQDAIDERVSALETVVALQADDISDLQDRVDALELEAADSETGASGSNSESPNTGDSITISGDGETVSDSFDLPAGNYKVTATVQVDGNVDGFAVWFYVDGGKDLLFNEIIDKGGAWTGSALLQVSQSGEVYFAVENTNSAWEITIEPK